MNPIKPTLKTEIVPLLFIAASAIAAYLIYPHLPARIPVHWNVAGQVDAYGSAKSQTLGFLGVIAGVYLLMLVFPFLDPKKERYADFAKVYHIFKGALVLVFAAIYATTLLNGLGYNLPVGKVIPGLIGVLFIVMGNYFGKIKFNWFMGIRTPWTMSSEDVWNKTHRLGGKLFMLAGALIIVSAFIPTPFVMPVFIAAVLLAALVPMAYSYYLYAKHPKA